MSAYRERNALTLIVLSAFVLRLFFVLVVFREVASGSGDHAEFGMEMGWVARSLAAGHGFSSPFLPATGPTALVPPLYPYLLSIVFRGFGIYTAGAALVILTLNGIFSALTAIPLYKLTLQIAGRTTATLAGWIWVFYPFSIFYTSTQVWDYSLTAMLFAWSWWMAQDNLQQRGSMGDIGLGAFYGLTLLSNPSLLTLYPIVLWMAVWNGRKKNASRLKASLLILFGTCLIVAPWAIRNHTVLHADAPVRDGFWLECWAGNHGDLSNSNPAAAHPASNTQEMSRYEQLGEVAYLADKRALTVAYVTSHPAQTIVVTLRRIVRFWTGFWSFEHDYRQKEPLDLPNLFFCTAVTGLMAYGLRRLWRCSPQTALPYLLVLIVFPLPYYLSHTSMDYRQPIEPLIIFLVALGCSGKVIFNKHRRTA